MDAKALSIILAISLLALGPSRLAGHCDTLDGPVIKDARAALEGGDVTPVLRWVRPEAEAEIRESFARALAVRALGQDARALADRFFFETVVRIHRQGEGAPYTGLKPAGVAPRPSVAAADRALSLGSVDRLVQMIGDEAEHGLRYRFQRARQARRQAHESLERGREWVAAYVEFVHYAERLHGDATSSVTHGGHEAASTSAAHVH